MTDPLDNLHDRLHALATEAVNTARGLRLDRDDALHLAEEAREENRRLHQQLTNVQRSLAQARADRDQILADAVRATAAIERVRALIAPPASGGAMGDQTRRGPLWSVYDAPAHLARDLITAALDAEADPPVWTAGQLGLCGPEYVRGGVVDLGVVRPGETVRVPPGATAVTWAET